MKFKFNLKLVQADGTITGIDDSTGLSLQVYVNGISIANIADFDSQIAAINANVTTVVIGSGITALLNLAVDAFPILSFGGEVRQTTDNPRVTFTMRIVASYIDSTEAFDLSLVLFEYNEEIDLYIREVGAPLYPTLHLSQNPIANSIKYNLTTGIPSVEVFVSKHGTVIATGAQGEISSIDDTYSMSVWNSQGGDSVAFELIRTRIAPQVNLLVQGAYSFNDIQFTEDNLVALNIVMDLSALFSFVYEATDRIHQPSECSVIYTVYRNTDLNTAIFTSSEIDIGAIDNQITYPDAFITASLYTFTPPDTDSDYVIKAVVTFRDWADVDIFRVTTTQALNVSSSTALTKDCKKITALNSSAETLTVSVNHLLSDGTWSDFVELVDLAVGGTTEYNAPDDGIYQFKFEGEGISYNTIVVDCDMQTCIFNAAKALIMIKPCDCNNCKDALCNYRFNFASLKQLSDDYFSILNVINLESSYQAIDTDLLEDLVDVKELLDQTKDYCANCGDGSIDTGCTSC